MRWFNHRCVQVKAKVKPLTAYANGVYRLETNTELYEGVRFGWIIFDPPAAAKPWHITGLRLVSQVKPVNYTGAFNSSDSTLSASWYSGAYGSRLNMMPYGFNSILIDRGDRVSIQGDGHPTMAAALSAFGSVTLRRSHAHCSSHLHSALRRICPGAARYLQPGARDAAQDRLRLCVPATITDCHHVGHHRELCAKAMSANAFRLRCEPLCLPGRRFWANDIPDVLGQLGQRLVLGLR